MKASTSILFLCVVALACLLHQASARPQRNWWETSSAGTPTNAASRNPTAAPSSTPAAPTNCPCPTTPEYNPVCGDNKVTYTNPGMLECAQNCGLPVRILFHGRCEKAA